MLPISAASSFTGRIVTAAHARSDDLERVLDSPTISHPIESPMSDAPAKLYINTGVVTAKSDIYNILRPLLKQTVSYTYHRGNHVASSGTGWVERLVVDHPEIASYFTPLAICVNLDSFDYLQFDTTSEQLLVYTLVVGDERVVLEFVAAGPRSAEHDGESLSRPLPRNADELARDLRFIQMELMMAPDAADEDEDSSR